VKVGSNFNAAAIHINYSFTTAGVRFVSSTDYGICQVNDYFHIGTNKDFSSAQYVLDNPEADIRFMCNYYQTHGNLNAWCSAITHPLAMGRDL
jgi:hypothetical protein